MSRRAFFLPFTACALLGAAGVAEGQEIALAARRPHFVEAGRPMVEVRGPHAAVLEQTVAVDLANLTIEAALRELSRQTGVRIAYTARRLPKAKRVTLSATRIDLSAVLTQILFGTGLDVAVAANGQLGVVDCTHFVPAREVEDTGSIVGRVTDKATGEPLVGATVMVEGTRKIAATGGDGRYRITGLKPDVYTVRARLIGYSQGTISVRVTAGTDVSAQFVLERSAQQLTEVVTTGTIVPTEVKALPTPVSVIGESDIANRRPNTVQELFRLAVPTAVAWDIPAFPQQTTFSARGAATLSPGSGQMKVFIDGIEVADPGLASVDPASIERLEVIRGPQAAAVYGSDAIGGVIQLFTKHGRGSPAHPQLDVQAAASLIQTPYVGYGAVLRHEYRASARGGATDATYQLGGRYSRTGDYLPNGEISAQSDISAHAGVHLSRGALDADISARYFVQNTGQVTDPLLQQTNFLQFSKPNYQPLQTRSHSVGAHIGLTHTRWWHSVITLGIDRRVDDLEQAKPRLTTPTDTLLAVSNRDLTKASIGYRTSFQRRTGDITGALTVGFDHYSYRINQFATSGALNTTGTIIVPSAAAISLGRTLTHNTGYFAQAQVGWRDALFATVGLRAEQNSSFGDSLGIPVAPRVGLSYVQRLGNATIKFRGAYGRAIRAPRPGQKLGSVAGTVVTLPNPTLAPERQSGWDAGIDIGFGALGSASITYYDQTAADLIQLVYFGGGSLTTNQHQNIGRVENHGLEVEANLATGWLQLHGQYGYSRSRIARLPTGYTGDLQIGDQSLLTPKHSAGVSVTATLASGTTANAALTYVGTWTSYDWIRYYRCLGGTGPCQPTLRDYHRAYPSLTKVNLTLAHQLTRHISGFVSINNLTNNQTHEFWDLMPVWGRITTVGLRFTS